MIYDYVINKPPLEDVLEHHGIKGMRWGVRRYQDKDGNLTEKGKKRYASMDGEKLRKRMQKQVRKAKKKKLGWSNQWLSQEPIGKESEKALNKLKKDKDKFYGSKEWKNYKYSGNDYLTDIFFNDKKVARFGEASRKTKNGWEESKEYSKSYGKKVTVGYLKDLGYKPKDAEYIANLLSKKNKNLH